MSPEITLLIEKLKAELLHMSARDREEVLEMLTDGFCVHCWYWVGDMVCHCKNDY